MLVTLAWFTLFAVVILWEMVCRASAGRWTSLARVGQRLWARPPGRVALIALWAFVGWHLFARYTLPV
jgi:hypothetical protein